MAAAKRPPVREQDLQGFKYYELIQDLLHRLHDDGTERDRAGNRKLFFDQYMALLLLYFFNPVIVSLRSLQKTTDLEKVQRVLGIKPSSLGSLSEAAGVFSAERVRDIVQELAISQQPLTQGREAEALRGLTAVDGTLLPALPRMAWALWQGSPQTARHRAAGSRENAAKLHLHFDVLKAVPCDAQLTPGASSETAQFRQMLQPHRLYVLDRGYADYGLFTTILEAQSSLIARVSADVRYTVAEEQPLSEAARAAGVVRDVRISRLGSEFRHDTPQQTLRLVVVERREADGTTSHWWLVTDRLDLDADLVALAYRYRWSVELFFRWFKCVLGCRHFILESANGVAMQCYAALIVSLLLVSWTGRKPTRRTWEMIQFYLLGWASVEELQRHLDSQRQRS
jgi:hypothetical protein